jgi:hypothetical protein
MDSNVVVSNFQRSDGRTLPKIEVNALRIRQLVVFAKGLRYSLKTYEAPDPGLFPGVLVFNGPR